ncbi:MAG: helix-turn-helix transcriptional regulator, partial [Chloroflexota bacterium]
MLAQATPKLAPNMAAMPRKKAGGTSTIETVGARLARLRKEGGMTPAELAAQLRLAQPNVSDYERDTVRLSADGVIQIAHILHVSPNDLLGFDEPQPSRSPSSWRLRKRLQDIERL